MEALKADSSGLCYTYFPDCYISRIIIKISQATYSGAIKTIYHLAAGILIGLPTACLGDTRTLTGNFYHLAKDLEEAWGWIIALFNEERGFQLIQRSQSSEIVNGVRVLYAQEAKKINLLQFRDMPKKEKQEIVQRFELAELQQNFFLEKLATINDNLLESISLFNLRANPRKLHYAHCRLKEFNQLSLKELNSATSDELELIFQRVDQQDLSFLGERCCLSLLISQLGQISANQLRKVDLINLKNLRIEHLFGSKEGIANFQALPLDLIQKILPKLPHAFFLSLKSEMIQKLDFSVLTEGEAFNGLFTCFGMGEECFQKLSLNQKLAVERIRAPDPEEIFRFYTYLPVYLLKCIPNEELKHFQLSRVDNFEILFPNTHPGIERFQAISSKQISEIVERLPDYLFPHISDTSLQDLDLLEKLKCHHIKLLFPNNEEIVERFKALSSKQLEVILGELPDYLLRLIFPQKLTDLKDLSKLTIDQIEYLFPDGQEETKQQFGLLSSKQVQTFLDKLRDYLFGLISLDQLKGLDLSKVSSYVLEKYLFPKKQKETKERFEVLSSGQVQAILTKLPDYLLESITITQLTGLNLRDLTDSQARKVLRGDRERIDVWLKS